MLVLSNSAEADGIVVLSDDTSCDARHAAAAGAESVMPPSALQLTGDLSMHRAEGACIICIVPMHLMVGLIAGAAGCPAAHGTWTDRPRSQLAGSGAAADAHPLAAGALGGRAGQATGAAAAATASRLVRSMQVLRRAQPNTRHGLSSSARRDDLTREARGNCAVLSSEIDAAV